MVKCGREPLIQTVWVGGEGWVTNSYASHSWSLGSFGERVVTPGFFAEFVPLAGLAALAHLLVAALAPGAFSI